MKLRHYLLLGTLFFVPLMSPLLFQTRRTGDFEKDIPSYHVTEYRGIENFPDKRHIQTALRASCPGSNVQMVTQETADGGIMSALLSSDNTYVTVTTNPTKGFAVTCAYNDTREQYKYAPLAQLFDAQEVITREI